jgi:uncharacterized membrane protein YqjE
VRRIRPPRLHREPDAEYEREQTEAPHWNDVATDADSGIIGRRDPRRRTGGHVATASQPAGGTQETRGTDGTGGTGGVGRATGTLRSTGSGTGEATGGRHAAEPSVGQLVSDVSTHLSSLIHDEIELGKVEIRSSVKNAGTGIGFFGAAAVVLVFSLTFGLIALAEGLIAIGLWRWLAYLCVFGFLLLLVGAFAYLGIRKVKRVKAPQRTISTSKDTVAYLKANTRRG